MGRDKLKCDEYEFNTHLEEFPLSPLKYALNA